MLGSFVKRLAPWAVCAASGALLALALPLAIPFLSLRELDPAGWMEWLAWFALVPAIVVVDRIAAEPRDEGAKGWIGWVLLSPALLFLLPITRLVTGRSGFRAMRRPYGLGFVAGAAYFYVAIWWVNHAMTSFGGMPMWQAFPSLSLLVFWMAAHWGLAFAVSAHLKARFGWPMWRHLPLSWAAFELLRNYFCSGFPWANLGYIQARHLEVSQLAALLGVYAIAALVVLVNAVLAELFLARREKRPLPRTAVIWAGCALMATVAYGFIHLSSVRAQVAAAPRAQVGLVQGNINQSVKNSGGSYADFILGRFLPLTLEADQRGADLVAWSEATYPHHVPPSIESFARDRLPTVQWNHLTPLPPLTRAHLLLGASTVEWRPLGNGKTAPEVTNSSFLVRPDLSVVKRYAKHHLVPFGEYIPLGKYVPFLKSVVPEFAPAVPGAELVTLEIPLSPALDGKPRPDTVRFAPMICYDAIFPEINVEFAASEPHFLLNPTNDAWYGYSSGPYQFLAIVRLRAIEVGRAVARPAYAGVTAIVMPTGEVAPGAIDIGPVDPDLAPDPNEPPRLLLGEVPLMTGRTIYSYLGDSFAYGASLFTVAAVVLARRRKLG